MTVEVPFLSPLYNKMHEVFPSVVVGKADPFEVLIQKVLNALPSHASFETIQDVLAAQYGVPDDFFKKTTDENHREQTVDRAYVDNLMGFYAETTSREYMEHPCGHWELTTVGHLDEVRINNHTQSRENLSQPVSQLGVRR